MKNKLQRRDSRNFCTNAVKSLFVEKRWWRRLPTRRREVTIDRISFERILPCLLPCIVLLFILAGVASSVRERIRHDGLQSHIEKFAKPFPKYGSPEFEKRCPWISSGSDKDEGPSVDVTMLPESSEGLAQWVSAIGTGYLLAEILDAKIVIDCGPLVDIFKIMEPTRSDLDWSVPKNFRCERNYRKVYGLLSESRSLSLAGQRLPNLPVYRHASQTNNQMNILRDQDFVELRKRLPGFRLNDGFACAFQSLIRLSLSNVSLHHSDLLTNLHHSLLDASGLVLSLYVRTGYTDEIVQAELEGRAWPDPGSGATQPSKTVTDCALELERINASESVVWMVISDSVSAKEWISSTFATETRQVFATQAKGKHTRPNSHPGTEDFVEAFFDWYLIGESHAVITNNRWYSYGFMGAARSSRPFYEALTKSTSKCKLVQWA